MFLQRVHSVDRMMFARHLSTILKSGMPFLEALRVLEQESPSSALRRILNAVANDVERGVKFSAALARHPKDFDLSFVSVAEVSEESGTLVENLEFLSHQLAKDSRMKRKVRGILFYPVLVLISAVFIGSFVGIFILPKFLNLFSALDVQMPLPTRALLWCVQFSERNGVVLVAAFFSLTLVFRWSLRFPRAKRLWHAMKFRIPVFGKFLKNAVVAEFFRGLGIMMRSGIPLMHALRIEERSFSNMVFARYAGKGKEGVASGEEFSKLLSRGEFREVPLLAVKMIAVGERTGKLDESFLFLADFFEEEADVSAQRLAAALEPILLFIIAGIVLFVSLSVITPIYSLTGSLNR